LQKNIDKLRTLTQIGYKPSVVATPYNAITIALSGSILALSLWIIANVRRLYIDFLAESTEREINSGMTITIIAGFVIMLGIILFNLSVIRRKIAQISKKQ
jgi:hypothetical protein